MRLKNKYFLFISFLVVILSILSLFNFNLENLFSKNDLKIIKIGYNNKLVYKLVAKIYAKTLVSNGLVVKTMANRFNNAQVSEVVAAAGIDLQPIELKDIINLMPIIKIATAEDYFGYAASALSAQIGLGDPLEFYIDPIKFMPHAVTASIYNRVVPIFNRLKFNEIQQRAINRIAGELNQSELMDLISQVKSGMDINTVVDDWAMTRILIG